MLAPELIQLIKDFHAAGIDYTKMSAQDGRQLSLELSAKRPRLPDAPPTEITQKVISLPGRDIPLRIYKPLALKDTKLPAIMYFHGGGFAWGKAEFYDDPCSIIAAKTKRAIISVDYRYAPEFPFPAALNDCYDSLIYITKHANQFNVDVDQLALAGDSAGGNLVAAVCLRARDENGPQITTQLLIFPWLEEDLTKKSCTEMGKDYILTTDLLEWFYNHYLPNKADRTNPLAMPLLAKNFANLPKAMIVVAKYDPLHDDGEDYAKHLQAAHIETKLICYNDMMHSFVVYGAFCPAALKAVEDLADQFAKFFVTCHTILTQAKFY